jgi:hypothetical protein
MCRIRLSEGISKHQQLKNKSTATALNSGQKSQIGLDTKTYWLTDCQLQCNTDADSSQYSARLKAHPNGLVVNLMEQPDNRRLRRHLPNDPPTRFLV